MIPIFEYFEGLPWQLIVGVALVASVVVFFIFALRYEIRHPKLKRPPVLAQIDRMTGEEFEHYLGEELKKEGFRIQYTPVTGDFGADLIMYKDKVKTVAQVKRYSNAVGIAAVQEVIGAKTYYDADEAAVITNSYYTRAAKELAGKAEVKLIDRNDIVRHIEDGRRLTATRKKR